MNNFKEIIQQQKRSFLKELFNSVVEDDEQNMIFQKSLDALMVSLVQNKAEQIEQVLSDLSENDRKQFLKYNKKTATFFENYKVWQDLI